MSILIEGMGMPKSGSALVLVIHPDGEITTVTGGRELPYKAVPVPAHGRLIDADTLLRGHELVVAEWGFARVIPSSVIKMAPTIIPAEEGK